MEKHHLVYKTTCYLTNRFYIGVHSTSNIEDGYLGSGKILRRSLSKYGIENHHREILLVCETKDDAFKSELQILSDLIADPLCMNIHEGGKGGWQTVNSDISHQKMANIQSQKIQSELRNCPEWKEKKSKKLSQTNKNQYASGERKKVYFYDWSGKSHSEETKKKISQKAAINQHGENNNQFGKKWLHNAAANVSKMVDKEDVTKLLNEGWIMGRKPK